MKAVFALLFLVQCLFAQNVEQRQLLSFDEYAKKHSAFKDNFTRKYFDNEKPLNEDPESEDTDDASSLSGWSDFSFSDSDSDSALAKAKRKQKKKKAVVESESESESEDEEKPKKKQTKKQATKEQKPKSFFEKVLGFFSTIWEFVSNFLPSKPKRRLLRVM